MTKHTKNRSTIKRKHRQIKEHSEANKAKTLDSKQLAKEYEPYNINKRAFEVFGED
ncbi:hypothetical protein [Lactiplantibacillus plantarum]|uniref:hypothetical protein n=1 Tax=Lactiplantibacillus plantarum TaxID=1590 RepID=UPI0021A66A99|nr:hypothetical protein [Lactiplantibacillus plantarum]MCT4452850.1 hypothetical protein [Lactiplantibacillus plantarum]MCT4460378.1 hypothetical protein [Lactiplantibacillus plantarum]